MTQRFVCEAFEANGTIARYVAGVLDESKSAEFENHYVTCARCQASVAAGSVVRQAPVVRTRRVRLPGWIALATAASLTGIVAYRGFQTSRLHALGDVANAPLYLGSPVRAANADAARFDSAMAAYDRADYNRSAGLLRTLGASDAREPVVPFFEGASKLMLGDAAAAEAAFTRVIDGGPSVYRAEAYFYRAKARLRHGDRDGAVSDLRASVQENGPVSRAALRLLNLLEH